MCEQPRSRERLRTCAFVWAELNDIVGTPKKPTPGPEPLLCDRCLGEKLLGPLCDRWPLEQLGPLCDCWPNEQLGPLCDRLPGEQLGPLCDRLPGEQQGPLCDC